MKDSVKVKCRRQRIRGFRMLCIRKNSRYVGAFCCTMQTTVIRQLKTFDHLKVLQRSDCSFSQWWSSLALRWYFDVRIVRDNGQYKSWHFLPGNDRKTYKNLRERKGMLFLYFKSYVNCASTFYTPIFQGYTRRGGWVGGGGGRGGKYFLSWPIWRGSAQKGFLSQPSGMLKGNDYMKV